MAKIRDPNLFLEMLDRRLRKRFSIYEGIELTDVICHSIRNECMEEVNKVFKSLGEEPLTEEEKDKLK